MPRIDGEHGSVGVVATIEKVGRPPSGEPAAVVRGLARARIGSGVPGPGAALRVEATGLATCSSSRRPAWRAGRALALTGQLGDVMKESAHIAWSYLRASGRRVGPDPNAPAGRRIHRHVPAGASGRRGTGTLGGRPFTAA